MDRRDFIKISAITGATAALDGCGQPERQLIRFIPEEDLVPGAATWKPGVCTLCSAGCGLSVRVMPGEAEVVRKGQLGLMHMGLVKKLEGNPAHPVNRGKLCPRGQASVQAHYHPDRIRTPLKLNGSRGSGNYLEIGWDEALEILMSELTALLKANEASALTVLTRPMRNQRGVLIEKFLQAFGAPPPVTFELFDEAVLRRANALSFGHAQLPTFDFGRANYLLSFGSDFLGTWNSPVAQAIGFGEMRQGRPGRRGKLVQFEPRMSLTGASADEWISCRIGYEGALALGIAHELMSKFPEAKSVEAGGLIAGWKEGLADFEPQSVEKLTGVPSGTMARLANEIRENPPAVAVISGAPLAGTNGLFNALAVNALNALINELKPAGEPEILQFTPEPPLAAESLPKPAPSGCLSALEAFVQEILLDQPHAPKVVLLCQADPVFGAPARSQVREALEKVHFIASFAAFLDDSSQLANLILPDHSPLESWVDGIPESGASVATVSLAPPAVHPLHETRAMPEVLLDIAHRLGGELATALPWKTFDEMLKASYTPLMKTPGSVTADSEDDFWEKLGAQGGWWGQSATEPPQPRAEPRRRARGAQAVARPESHAPLSFEPPEFDGADSDFPFHFMPFASQAFGDGTLAHLPWMQELPDPLATAMWGTWVEINPRTAEAHGIRQGDLVEIASPLGSLEAPALLAPGIAPDVVAMPVGQGHEHYGRYASGRGANPIAILSPKKEAETGAMAWAATRVRITRVGEGKLILFAGGLSRFPEEGEHR
jgi:anaerobic selenocysteine-containing dehydrogenase